MCISDSGTCNGESQCIDAYDFEKKPSWLDASIFMNKLAVSVFFTILHLIIYFNDYGILFIFYVWGD